MEAMLSQEIFARFDAMDAKFELMFKELKAIVNRLDR